MNPLLKRYFAEQKSFARLRRQCESKVVRWEFWNWPRWHLDPQQMLEFRALAQLAKRVPKAAAEYAYGYDEQNRVVVLRHGQSCIHQEFLRYSGNKIAGSTFVGNTAADAYDATLSQGRVVRIERACNVSLPLWIGKPSPGTAIELPWSSRDARPQSSSADYLRKDRESARGPRSLQTGKT
jgi:hypothetical protein